MPKKTKREKIIAEYRRKLSIVSSRPDKTESIKEHLPIQPSSVFTPTFTLKQSAPKNDTHDVLALDPQEFLAIKKDLIMTLALTGCVLIGQIILWRVMG
jgi:hypothetical protein